MAEKDLSPERLEAGREYLAAMKKLGLHPEGLLWAFDDAVDEPALVLVTSFYDQVGPLEVNKLLFRAYNLSVTPKSISPFIIRLHSPFDDVAKFIDRFVIHWGGPGLRVREPGDESRPTWTMNTVNKEAADIPVTAIGIANTTLHAFANGLYVWRHPKQVAFRQLGQWGRIRNKVEALAA